MNSLSPRNNGTRLRRNNNNNNGNLSYGKYTRYQPYLNIYRWLNTIKNTVVQSKQRGTGKKVSRPLTQKNIDQIKNEIMRKMKPVRKGQNMFTSWLPPNGKNTTFYTKNGTAWLSVSLGNNANRELVKMYIQKTQPNGRVALYRVIPQTNFLKSFNHHAHVPIRNYYNKLKLNGVGFVKTT